jgi:hypothetical protein
MLKIGITWRRFDPIKNNKKMKSRATVIYKSYMTYFHTFLPVYFYGMPDGKIYVVYAFFTKTENNQEGLEFVFAIHEDFRYNHKYDKIFTLDWTELSKADFMKKVDEPDQRIEIIEVRKYF